MTQVFTPQAIAVFNLAQEIAKQSGESMFHSHHVLIALTQSPTTKQRLEAVGVTYENASRVAASEFPPGAGGSRRKADTYYSTETQEIVKASVVLKAEQNLAIVTTDVLLLALQSVTSSNAYKCLKALSVDFTHYKAVIQASIVANGGKEPASNEDSNRSTVFAGASPSSPSPGSKGKAVKTKMLDQFGVNLTRAAREGKLDPVIGREKEIRRAFQVLVRRTKNNPILIGEPGVGKTAVVEGIAQLLLKSTNLPPHLQGKDIWSLEMGGMVAGSRYRGDFEERIKQLIVEVQNADVILFIDEIHSFVNSGSAEGGVTGSNMFKPLLARGQLQVIGATTIDEYRQHFEKDAALARRFQQVQIDEPTVEDTITILNGLKSHYEKHHNVIYTPEAIDATVILSKRYITDRFLPDKAIDLLDEAGATAKLNSFEVPEAFLLLEKEISDIMVEKDAALAAEDLATASKLTERERELRAESFEIMKQREAPSLIDVSDIATVLTGITGIPVNLAGEERKRLRKMEEALKNTIIGQDKAVSSVAKAVRRQRAGLKDPNRPAGSFIFAGSTGVGKTETVKALADFLFQNEKALITFDMSEFSEKHTVSRLFGAPPGFVGHESGGELTEAIRRNPYSIILLDEIEKAHDDIFNALLQMLEEGRMSDGTGRTVDFKNAIVVMTTNIGANKIQSGGAGFRVSEEDSDYEYIKSKVMSEMKQKFRPEFLNRIDDIIVFSKLTDEHMLEIVDISLNKVNKRLQDSAKITLSVSDEVKAHLIRVDAEPTLGARPLRRTIQNLIEDPLSEFIMYDVATNGHIAVEYVNQKLIFNGIESQDISKLDEDEEKIVASLEKSSVLGATVSLPELV